MSLDLSNRFLDSDEQVEDDLDQSRTIDTQEGQFVEDTHQSSTNECDVNLRHDDLSDFEIEEAATDRSESKTNDSCLVHLACESKSADTGFEEDICETSRNDTDLDNCGIEARTKEISPANCEDESRRDESGNSVNGSKSRLEGQITDVCKSYSRALNVNHEEFVGESTEADHRFLDDGNKSEAANANSADTYKELSIINTSETSYGTELSANNSLSDVDIESTAVVNGDCDSNIDSGLPWRPPMHKKNNWVSEGVNPWPISCGREFAIEDVKDNERLPSSAEIELGYVHVHEEDSLKFCNSSAQIKQELSERDSERQKKKRKTKLSYKVLRYLQFSMFAILVLDVILISLQIVEKGDQDALQYAGIIIACVFVVDLSLRLYAYGPKMLKSVLEALDAIVVGASFVITMVLYVYNGNVQNNMQYLKLLIIGRPVRYIRLFRLWKYRETFQEVSRKIVSQNRARWEDEEYNLDLTYITDQILVMSFPSEGCTTIFRNSSKEVAHFLNERHTGQHYTIYNLCSENMYDTSIFDGQVIWCPIDDHNVPGLRNMLSFTQLIRDFVGRDKENVAVIHCKGGKGRTGTIVAAMLILSGDYDAEESLQYFASARTDKKIHCCRTKEQGVRVPSQIRYVHYFEKVMKEHKGMLPRRRELLLHSITITYSSAISAKKGRDLIFKVKLNHPEKCWEYDLTKQDNCTVDFNAVMKCVSMFVASQPLLCDDVKITCYHSQRFPWKRRTCLFYFWFHTSFVDGYILKLNREDMDPVPQGLCAKEWKDFQLQLAFLDERPR